MFINVGALMHLELHCILNVEECTAPPVGSGVKKLMYNHETEQP